MKIIYQKRDKIDKINSMKISKKKYDYELNFLNFTMYTLLLRTKCASVQSIKAIEKSNTISKGLFFSTKFNEFSLHHTGVIQDPQR